MCVCACPRWGWVRTNQTTKRRNDATTQQQGRERKGEEVPPYRHHHHCRHASGRLVCTLHPSRPWPARGPPSFTPKHGRTKALKASGRHRQLEAQSRIESSPVNLPPCPCFVSATRRDTRHHPDSLAAWCFMPPTRSFLSSSACAACLGCCTTHSPIKSQPHGFEGSVVLCNWACNRLFCLVFVIRTYLPI